VPAELCGVYPSIHIDVPRIYSREVINDLVNTLLAALSKYRSLGAAGARIAVRKGSLLEEVIKKRGVKVEVEFI
jgi:hypothetical protein